MSDRERIEKLIEALGISARQFADEIRVQPSTISNMMVGRNNPSLDVMKRILLRYPSLNSEWLIAGRGDMWREGQMPADVLLPLVEEEEKPEEPKEEPQPQLQLLRSRYVVSWCITRMERMKSIQGTDEP